MQGNCSFLGSNWQILSLLFLASLPPPGPYHLLRSSKDGRPLVPLRLGAFLHSWRWPTAHGCLRAQLEGGDPFPATDLGPRFGSWAVVTPFLGFCWQLEGVY